jgi:uncharacterized integral membrane protein (TIGR00698 family)
MTVMENDAETHWSASIVNQVAFFGGLIVAASGLVSAPIALAAGLAYGLAFVNPHGANARAVSRWLLQASVVGLGFGMDLGEVLRVGRSGFLYTAVTIATTMVLGLMIGRLFRVERTPSFLISTGTAICGGSAIAAVAPIINASEDEMAVSLGTVFILNSVALLLFPVLGGRLHLSQEQFGLWAALAIHDTSSVVGATARYGPVALAVGTAVKLGRALWIVPLSAVTAIVKRSGTAIQWPWFILFFCFAAFANTFVPAFHSAYSLAHQLGITGLVVTLYLIGTSLSRETLRQVGIRPLLQGLLLWFIVALASLALIRGGWIHL